MGSATVRLTAKVLTLSTAMSVLACGGSVGGGSPRDRGPSNGSNVDPSSTTTKPGSPAAANPSPDVPGGPVLVPDDPGAADVTFEIRSDRDTRPISSLIYGVNGVQDVANNRWGLLRLGGNRLTAYNWENNASNAGSDYLFQNDSLMATSDAPAKPLLELIDAASSIGAAALITIANVDYVAADKNGNGDVRASGPNYLSTRFKRNQPKKTAPFAATPDATDDAVYQDELVAFLKAQRPNARILFSMDNEPDLWSHTHAEVYPNALTYADLWKRNRDYAKATKEAWPNAEVLGFGSYGYTGFQSLQNAPDAGGRNFIEWYLDQAQKAESTDGKRLIDYLDLHWYPEAQGGGQRITLGGGNGPEVVTAREQAPRSLWDPTYQETSWVRDAAGGPIDLLHWLKPKIDSHYPATKLSFTEWNYGGGNHISGAIATADVLGIFGRYGVGVAAYWPLSEDEKFAYAAFRAFRNFDGKGGAFGDTSVDASSSDSSVASVYASIDRNNPTRTVIIAINKGTTTKSAAVKVGQTVAYSKAQVFVLSGGQPAITSAPAIPVIGTNAFKYDMPAQSISILVPQR